MLRLELMIRCMPMPCSLTGKTATDANRAHCNAVRERFGPISFVGVIGVEHNAQIKNPVTYLSIKRG